MPKNKFLIVLSYFILYTIWSTTYYAIKIGVKTFPTFLFIGLRWFFSGVLIVLVTFFFYKKNMFKNITKKQIFNSIIIGVFLLILSNSLMSEGMKTVDSYIGAIIGAMSPLIMTLFDYFISGIKFNKAIIPAIFLGVLGVAILLYKNNINASFDFHLFFILISVTVWSFASALSHKVELPKNSFINTSIQMFFAGTIGIFIFFINDGSFSIIPSLSIDSMIALFYLIVFGSLGMIAYVYLLKHEPLSRLSTYAFVNPIGAVILGVLIAGEKITSTFFFAFPLILIALLIMLRARVKGEHMEVEAEK